MTFTHTHTHTHTTQQENVSRPHMKKRQSQGQEFQSLTALKPEILPGESRKHVSPNPTPDSFCSMAPSQGMAVPPSNPALSWNSSSDLTLARYWHLTGLAQGVIFLMTREQKPRNLIYLFLPHFVPKGIGGVRKMPTA